MDLALELGLRAGHLGWRMLKRLKAVPGSKLFTCVSRLQLLTSPMPQAAHALPEGRSVGKATCKMQGSGVSTNGNHQR